MLSQKYNCFSTMAILFILLTAISTIDIISAQQILPFLGDCPDVQVMKNFSIQKFSGIWYEQEKYLDFLETEGNCTYYRYSVSSDGSIHADMHQVSKLTGEKNYMEADVRSDSNTGEAKLIMKILSFNVEIPIWVLGTDYEEYAVKWSCTQSGKFSTRFSWILTRDRYPQREVLEKAYNVLKTQQLQLPIEKTSQTNCEAI